MRSFLKQTILFILFPIAVAYAFVYIYEKPQRDALKNGTHSTQEKWLDIQNPNNIFNVIIVGSSRGDSAYNPFIIDSISKTNSYNLCSGSQNIVETYYIIKEVLKYQKPEVIVYDTFLPSLRNEPNYFHVLSNAEFMSKNGKWDMIINGFGSQGIYNYIFPFSKYKSYLKRDLKNSFTSKRAVTVNSYRIRGYYYSDNIVDLESINNYKPLYSFKNTSISTEKTEHYISLISELCKDNNIIFLPVRAPYPPTRLKKSETDPAHFYFEKMYSALDVSFYDFNYSNSKEYIDFDFSDDHHLNNWGAKKASRELGTLISILRRNP